MQCPYCKELESRVTDSRLAGGGSLVWRRRECDACHKRFTTYERVEYALPTVVKRDGQREAFDRGKILEGLRIACNKRAIPVDTLEQTAQIIEQELAERGEREVQSRDIGEAVMDRLRQLDEIAYVRFASVYRSFKDIDEFLQEMDKLSSSGGPRAKS